MEILDNLDPVLRIFWFIAIPASVIFLIQMVMTFMGTDASDGVDADFDSNLHGTEAPFQLFSLRNLINFMLGFGWAGISFFSVIPNKALLIIVSLLVGASFVLLFFLIIKQIRKLAEDNSFQISNTLNKTAEVYLTIPGNKSGKGKIMISINGAYHELPAMTSNGPIASGAVVKVVSIENKDILIVEPI